MERELLPEESATQLWPRPPNGTSLLLMDLLSLRGQRAGQPSLPMVCLWCGPPAASLGLAERTSICIYYAGIYISPQSAVPLQEIRWLSPHDSLVFPLSTLVGDGALSLCSYSAPLPVKL